MGLPTSPNPFLHSLLVLGEVWGGGGTTTDAGGVQGDSSSAETPKPLVKQDLWHIEDRVLKHASKGNGAYRPFCGALRDALAIPDPEVMDRVREVVKKRCLSRGERDVNAFMRGNFSNLILKHVPRIVPPAPILAERFVNVIDSFKEVHDAT